MNDEMVHKLIKAVRRYPCLYDKNSVDYRNKWRKEKAWQEVQTEVRVTMSECRARWRSLRDRFVREHANNSKSGSSPHPWIHLKALSFLISHVALRKKSISQSVWAKDINDLKNCTKSSSEGYQSLEKPSISKRSKHKRTSFDFDLENDMELTSFPYEYEEETTAPFEPAHLPPEEYYQDETYVSTLPELASFNSCSSSDISQQSLEVKSKSNKQLHSLIGTGSECVVLNETRTTKSQSNSQNEEYYKVLDSYMRKLSEEDQDEVKIDILNMVYKRSKGYST